jgi:hypothetical protein
MTTTFKRGQELSRSNGLNIFLKSKDGSPSNAAQITYNIYDFTTGVEVLLPPSGRVPLNPSVGEYYASFIIPIDSNIGNFRIRWFFSQYLNSPQVQIVQEFAIVQDATQIVTVPGITPIELDTVRSLRILLRDNSPARNYHFMPPTGEDSVNQFTRVFGFIWEDCELLEYLNVSNDAINMYPPVTQFASIDQLITQYRPWRTLLLTGAMVYALQAVSLNWVADEMSYSISGVSLDLEKSSKYQSMMNDADARFKEFATTAKEGVKIIRGLKQSRFGVGIRSSFGPSVGRGTLSPRRFVGL